MAEVQTTVTKESDTETVPSDEADVQSNDQMENNQVLEESKTEVQENSDEVPVNEDAAEDNDDTTEKVNADSLDESIPDGDKAEKEDENEETFDFSAENTFEENDENMDSEEIPAVDQEDMEGAKEEVEGDGTKDEVGEDEEDEEEEDVDDSPTTGGSDPNVMPQVNVAVLAQRKWQVKVYPLKPADFVSGQISRVFKNARESLLYLLSPGRNARGKGEMYISSANQAMRAVFSLMRLTYFYPEINVEIIKKNDEGAIEEKAYIRFDSKMTNLLTLGSFRAGPGRKRERLIGSVFVKNLPAGTTKDALRVMFPFAQEINYNPEKFKDCTARLVLKSRNHVIPCLKAFAKVELGGNVLELHPLEKKKRTRPKEDEAGAPEAKHRKKSEDGKKEESSKEDSSTKEECKSTESSKKEGSKHESLKETKGDSKEKSEVKSIDGKDKKDAKPSTQKTSIRRGIGNRLGGTKKDQGRNDQNKSFRPKLIGGQEKRTRGHGVRRGGAGRTDWPTDRGDRNKGRLDKSPATSRNFRDDRNKSGRLSGGGNYSFGRNSRGFGGNRNSHGSGGRMNYSLANQGLGPSVSQTNANLAINADATKEMVILQNQLSMAIKNQLAMLNQTQMAVEQVKRGATGMGGLGSDVPQATRVSPKAFGSGSGYGKRAVDQYRRSQGDDQSYSGVRNRSRDRGMRGSRGGQGGSFGKRGGAYRDKMEDSYHDRASDMDLGISQGSDLYGRSRDFSYDSRDFNQDSFGSSGRSGYGQDNGGYSGYHY